MDEARGLQCGETIRVQRLRSAPSVHGEEQQAARREQAAKLGEPHILRGFVQMGKDGKAIDHIEVPIRIGQGRQGAIANEAG